MSRSQCKFVEHCSIQRPCEGVMQHTYTALHLPPRDLLYACATWSLAILHLDRSVLRRRISNNLCKSECLSILSSQSRCRAIAACSPGGRQVLAQPLRAGPVLLDKALQRRHCKLADCPIACEVSALSYTLEHIAPQRKPWPSRHVPSVGPISWEHGMCSVSGTMIWISLALEKV